MAWERLVTVDAARQLLLDAIRPIPKTERVELAAASGRVTAQDIVSSCDVPGFPRSRVDGYAVRAADTFGASESLPAYLDVIGEVKMGQPAETTISPGQAVAVPTGGMLPSGADAAIMFEHTTLSGSSLSVLRPAAPGEHVVRAGEDIARGSVVVHSGTRLRAAMIGALAGAGVTCVPVRVRPVVAVLSTGDEIVPPDDSPGPGQVRDINGPALAAALERDGACADYRGVICDDELAITDGLRSALTADMVFLSGGSSVGARDLTARALEKLGRPGVLAHGIVIKPGKPTIIGAVGDIPVIGLPGHPSSAMVVYEAVIRPAVVKMTGLAVHDGARVRARLGTNVGSAIGREDYLRVTLSWRDDELWADVVPGHSALIGALARSHGLAVIPAPSSGCDRGEQVTVLLEPRADGW